MIVVQTVRINAIEWDELEAGRILVCWEASAVSHSHIAAQRCPLQRLGKLRR